MKPTITRHSWDGYVAGNASTNALIVIVAIAALVIGVGLYNRSASQPPVLPEFERVILLPAPRTLSPFELVTDTGNTFSNDSVKGSWSLLFFGFTHCPDICPTTLLSLKNARAALEQTGEWPNLNVHMVSVDPARDNPERLNQYVRYFHPEFTGVTGDQTALTEFAKELGILFVQRESDESGYYQVDHSVSLVLLNERGQYAGVLTAPHEAPTLENDLRKLYQHLTDTSNLSATTTAVKQEASPASAPEVGEPNKEITVRDAWIRLSPPTSSANAGYLSIANGPTPTQITAVSSPVFDEAMIHATTMNDGMAQMAHVEAIELQANETFTLKPMGHHLMLIDATKPINEGDLIPITLTTSRGEKSFIAEVRAQAPTMSAP